MFISKYEDTYAEDASAVAFSKGQLFSILECGVQRTMPFRLGRNDDIVLDHPSLQHQIFDTLPMQVFVP
ncbi:unnamed protein product [Haemonchus placei]|uniref:Transposase n=1 Tax=Haemonchus placei TaxID=6290 RepID=A0A0N4W2K9_HAEPC|nr:unnamed protein product [Haemonchus placei]